MNFMGVRKADPGGQKSKVGGQRNKVGDQKNKVGGQKNKVGGQKNKVRVSKKNKVGGQKNKVRGLKKQGVKKNKVGGQKNKVGGQKNKGGSKKQGGGSKKQGPRFDPGRSKQWSRSDSMCSPSCDMLKSSNLLGIYMTKCNYLISNHQLETVFQLITSLTASLLVLDQPHQKLEYDPKSY